MTSTVAPSSFSAQLKQATAERHATAEHSSFMTDLMQGSLSALAYGRLLAQYVPLYTALEEAVHHHRMRGGSVLDLVDHPGLDRLPAILHDLDALRAATSDALDTAPLPATQAYASRIREIAEQPERLLAHHYLRYLGDLSGGQAIAALMARHYGINAEALTMYRFPTLPRPKEIKDGYREQLDNAPLSAEQREAVIDEAIRGFDLSAAMFADIEQSL